MLVGLHEREFKHTDTSCRAESDIRNEGEFDHASSGERVEERKRGKGGRESEENAKDARLESATQATRQKNGRKRARNQ